MANIILPERLLEEIVQSAFDRGVKYADAEPEIRSLIGKKFVKALIKQLEAAEKKPQEQL